MDTSAMLRTAAHRGRRTDARFSLRDLVRNNKGLFFTGFVCALYLAWSFAFRGTEEQRKVIADVVEVIVAFIGGVWSLFGQKRSKEKLDRRSRITAALLSLSIFGYAGGMGIYDYYDLVLHQTPFPSWADVSYLFGTLAMVLGILRLPSRPLPWVVRIRVLLDGLMIAAALITFSWYFTLGPILMAGGESLLGRILGAAYPVFDIMMMCALLASSAGASEPSLRRVRKLVCVGIITYVIADSVYAYGTLHETYNTGHWIDAGWMVTNLIMAQATVLFRRSRRSPATDVQAPVHPEAGRQTSIGRLLLPYAFVPAMAVLLYYVWRTSVHGPLAVGVYVGAAVLLALIIARQILAIAENARLYRFLQAAYRELEALATTDSMTGLPNHRTFQERLRACMEAEAAQGPTALLLVDVDRFKQYNDHFGHPAGDQALKLVANLLKENIRSSDLAARYGGEEFAVILAGTTVEEAIAVAERVRQTCEQTKFPHRAVTLSIGVATTHQWQSAGSLIEAADQALYAAKHAGRNQVVWESAVDEEAETKRTLFVASTLPAGWSLEASRQTGLDRLNSASELFNSPVGPVVKALLAMLDLRDHEVERHSDRVMRFCLRLANEAALRNIVPITPDEMSNLHLGALLHDIGKVGVPDAILNKPGALTAEEWTIVQRHPIQGAELLEGFPQLAGAVPVVRSHHERWDGTGYPDGLAGEAIPVPARLFALADTLDAMSSDRPYRKALPFSEIRREVIRMSGKQFDPALVEAFLAVPEAEWQSLQNESEMQKAA